MSDTTAADPFDLQRFILAQEGPYPIALRELREGQKRSHWMWFIFPQIEGLGSSPMAQRFALRSHAEATAYLAHPQLGPRLLECAGALLGHAERPIRDILGSPDDLKLRSCATLFASVTAPDSAFHRLLATFFDNQPDPHTIERLERAG